MQTSLNTFSKWATLACLAFQGALTLASHAQVIDHGGRDWSPAPGEEVFGTHQNVGRFLIPPRTSVFVKGYDGVQFGSVEIRARAIDIQGRLDASGRGGGAPGGPGGGGGLDQARGLGGAPGSGGIAGRGASGAANGNAGSKALSDDSGGLGWDGRMGLGGHGGAGGKAGGAAGHAGTNGHDGGYEASERNGDSSTDEYVHIGSGGGAGGSGAGGHSTRVNSGGGGGGGGAAGGVGGGCIRLMATESLTIGGELLANGTTGGNGARGQNGSAYRGPSNNGAAGDGGQGGNATSIGAGQGGPGGEAACDIAGAQVNHCSGKGGDGGGGGAGAGGGISLRAPVVSIAPSAQIKNLGGHQSAVNGGTLKIFHGCSSALSPQVLFTGRLHLSTVTDWVHIPSIQSQPASQSLCEASPLSLCVQATGPTALSYQWRFNGQNLPGATSSCLNIPAANASMAGSYSVLVVNACGSVESAAAIVTVSSAPVIVSSPSNLTSKPGDTVALCVEVRSTQPVTYTWMKNGNPVTGANQSCLRLKSITSADAGAYTVKISNSCGSRTTAPATLTVVNPLVGKISGKVWHDRNTNGVQDNLVVGSHPDVLFVLDRSGSTTSLFQGSPIGDVNNDHKSNTILDAEIQGFIALNKQLIDQGLASRCRIGIITFNGSHTTFLFPSSTGPQSYTAPSADQNGNGALDVDEALRGLRSGGDTQFGGALTAAEAWFKSMKTAPGNANLVFVSDGEPKDKNYQPVVARLRSEGVTMRAFGAGTGASLSSLQLIDPQARIFTTSDELIQLFGGVSGSQNSFKEEGLAGVSVYLDTNRNGKRDAGEPTAVTRADDPATPSIDESGDYQFEKLATGVYNVRQDLANGTTQTFPTANASQWVDLRSSDSATGVNFGRLPSTHVTVPAKLTMSTTATTSGIATWGPGSPIETQIQGLRVSADQLTMNATTVSGKTYRIEISNDLRVWSLLRTFVAQTAETPLTLSATDKPGSQFFRVIAP